MERSPVPHQEQDKSVFDLADDVVTHRVIEEIVEATERMRKAFEEGHCNCLNCKKEAISEMNSLIDFVDEINDLPRYGLDGKNLILYYKE